MGNFTFENILISFIVTWGIGLLPPTLIRYVFLKRPVGNWAAIGICGLFYFFSFLVYSAISGSTRGHGALILVAMVSYWILRKDSPIKRGVETEVPPSRQSAASQPPVIGSVAVARSSTLAYPSESRTTPHPPDMSAQTTPPPATTYQASALDEDAIYEIVANEMDSGRMDKGLWTRLFAELDGDEKKAKIAYIKQRAEKLMAAERARLQELARQNAEEAALSEKVRLEREEKVLILGLKADELRLRKIRSLAQQHNNSPRMTIDEKDQLLRLAGGSFTWLDGHGEWKCTATFKGEERQFSSGQDFSIWFTREVVPFLIGI